MKRVFIFLLSLVILFSTAPTDTFASTDDLILDNTPVDVVYKYIDLNDPNLRRDGIKQIKKDYDNEELRYSLRSVLQNIPWVRKIFIIMPNEKVRFLKEPDEISDKIVYVKDKDLIGFDSASSLTFEFNLWRLKEFGCSENFIYFNDDCFVGKPMRKSDFFYVENNKVVPYFLYNAPVGYGQYARLKKIYKQNEKNSTKQLSKNHLNFKFQRISALMFLYKCFNCDLLMPTDRLKYYPHNALGMTLSEVKEIYDLVVNNYEYKDDCISALCREPHSLQHQTLYGFYIINKYHRKINHIPMASIDLAETKNHSFDCNLFCINTRGRPPRGHWYTEQDYSDARRTMMRLFPNKTEYELPPEEIGISKNDMDKKAINVSIPAKRVEPRQLYLQKKKALQEQEK